MKIYNITIIPRILAARQLFLRNARWSPDTLLLGRRAARQLNRASRKVWKVSTVEGSLVFEMKVVVDRRGDPDKIVPQRLGGES